MKEEIFELETYRAKGSKVFTGRDKGKYVRVNSKFDEIEKNNDKVIFKIPANLFSINPSFFEELLINVVLKLGKQGFIEKYEFVNEGKYKFEKPLNEAIDRILRENNAL
jgi:restriction endonuclease Mrr